MTTDPYDLESGVQVVSCDLSSTYENLGYFEDWKEAWEFAKAKNKEYQEKYKTDHLNVKSVTIHTMELFDVYNFCKEKYGK